MSNKTKVDPDLRDLAPLVQLELDNFHSLVAQGAEYLSINDLLPDNYNLLPTCFDTILSGDERALWETLEDGARRRLITLSTARRVSSIQRRLAIAERNDLCGRYIDLLYQLGHTRRSEVGEERYAEIRQEMYQAKADWEANKKRSINGTKPSKSPKKYK